MKKWMISMAVATLLSGQAQAHPIEAIASFFVKIFIGGAAKEAVVAGRVGETGITGSTRAKGIEHLAAGDAARAGSVLPVVEPKPALTADVAAKSRADANAYKALRASAGKGDSTAMLKMSEMTASGRVSDPGEPWHGYWTFQAARLGHQAAIRKMNHDCSSDESRRATDRGFDSACSSSDGHSLYARDKMPGPYSLYGPESLASSTGQP